MRIAILHNSDHTLLEEDPGREAREDVLRVAAAMQSDRSVTAHTVAPVGSTSSAVTGAPDVPATCTRTRSLAVAEKLTQSTSAGLLSDPVTGALPNAVLGADVQPAELDRSVSEAAN